MRSLFLCHTYTPLAVGVQHGAGHVFGIDEETVRREAERIEGIAGVQDQILVGAGEVVGGLVLIVEDLGAGDLIGVDAVVGRDRDRRTGLGVLQVIEEFAGVLPFGDKASPEVIKRETGLSKNAFKRAVGRLYKEHRVEITERSIRKVD